MEKGVQIVHPLRVETAKGFQKMNCATTAGILRIIQSIPSPKAEPSKMWLVGLGKHEIEFNYSFLSNFTPLSKIHISL
jgi:hypothetical protein